METSLQKLLRRVISRRPVISVVGDAMVDEYFFVSAERISPEFPIVVMQIPNESPSQTLPGGAANACRQFVDFNADVKLFGMLDEYGRTICERYDIPSSHSVMLPNSDVFAIPKKRRFYHGNFPLCRIDVESKNFGLSQNELHNLQIQLLNKFEGHNSDVVVFSDYNKGVFDIACKDMAQKWLERSSDSITIVDPKVGPISRWKGCSIIKPNEAEAINFSGETDWRKQVDFFFKQTDCQAVVITQAGRGVVGNVMGREFEYRPESPIVAKSVIGAGDCFVSTLALCMAHAIDIIDAAEIAFNAGAKYVGHQHNRPLLLHELHGDKFVKPEHLARRDFTLAITNGVFDLIHPGHLNTLKFAKSKADKLVVAINSDESASRLNKSHPVINDLAFRKQMIAALESVDFVVEFDEDTPYNLIQTIKPDVLVKGSEYDKPVGSDIVKMTYPAPMVKGYSSTDIINKIKNI